MRRTTPSVSPSAHSAKTFAQFCKEALADAGITLEHPVTHPDALASLSYSRELELKQAAFRAFLRANHLVLPSGADAIVATVQPRGYRSTSKRRVEIYKGRVTLQTGKGHATSGVSPLEPESHGRIYRATERFLRERDLTELPASLNFCIIRGNAASPAVILNVCRMSGALMREIKLFSAFLRQELRFVESLFVYVDETRSEYYLESVVRPEHALRFKKLFGSDYLAVRCGGRKFLYPPTVFSQINEPMLDVFTQTVREAAGTDPAGRLIDLYCGYGLLGFVCGDAFREVIGMEMAGEAINAARFNAGYLFPGKMFRYIAGAVTGESMGHRFPKPSNNMPETILLDPPRAGTLHGVADAVAARRPARIVAVFCGTDRLVPELREWRRQGYGVTGAWVLDFFPGTMNLETVIRLEPAL